MPPSKTTAIILNVHPYRETSALLTLFTREYGLIRGIAKGIRSAKKDAVWLERGVLAEVVVYLKAHSSLHLVTGISVAEPFAATRGDLFKAAVRDGMLEVAGKSIHEAEPHPQIMTLFLTSLEALDRWPARCAVPFLLWMFYLQFTQLMGFGANLTACFSCGKEILHETGGNLRISKGGIECSGCDEPDYAGAFLPPAVLQWICSTPTAGHNLNATLNSGEQRRITGLLASFCQYHFESRSELKSVLFLDQLMAQHR